MKKLLLLIIASLLLCSCAASDNSITPDGNLKEQDLKPFELLGGYRLAENGDVMIPEPAAEKTEADYEELEELFFGSWKGKTLIYGRNDEIDLIIDENSRIITNADCLIKEDVFIISVRGASAEYFWLDTAKPNTLYRFEPMNGSDNEGVWEYNAGNLKRNSVLLEIYTKTAE